MGETFTVAGAYLVTVLNWARAAGIDLAPWPGLVAFRFRERPVNSTFRPRLRPRENLR